MLRGLDRTALFLDDVDRAEFMSRLKSYKEKCEFRIFSYSLMQNHIHLLLGEGPVSLSDALKGLSLSYSRYFNKRYDRLGYLFQGRYLSEAVDTSEYLLSVIRYIHNNPLEVGEDISYWTSYNEFVGEECIVDVSEVLAFIDPNDTKPDKGYLHTLITKAPLPSKALGSEVRARISDTQALKIIGEVTGFANPLALAALDRKERDEFLVALKQRRLSVRQISRLTGITRGIAQNAKS